MKSKKSSPAPSKVDSPADPPKRDDKEKEKEKEKEREKEKVREKEKKSSSAAPGSLWIFTGFCFFLGLVMVFAPKALQLYKRWNLQQEEHKARLTEEKRKSDLIGVDPSKNWIAGFAPNASPEDYIAVSINLNFTSNDTVLTSADSVRFSRLLNWIKDNGGEIDDVEIRTWPNSYERGVFARNDIKKGHFAVIPRTVSFNSKNALASGPIRDFLQDIKDNLGWDDVFNDRAVLGMFLVYEKLVTKEASFWFPYIDTLPRSGIRYSSFMFATPEDLQRWKIDGIMGASLKVVREVVAKMVEKAKTRPDIFPFSDELLEAEFLWGYYMVMSRAWSRDSLEMIPFGDIMNHQVNSPVTLMANETHNNFDILDDLVIPKGAEVYDTYQKTPSPIIYSLSWGFIPGSEECFLPFEKPVRHLSLDKKRLLSNVNCLTGRDRITMNINCALQDLSPGIMNCLRILAMDEKDVKNATEWFHVFRALPNNHTLIEASPQIDIQGLEWMAKSFLDVVERLSPEEEARMSQSGTDVVEKLALRLRYTLSKCNDQVNWVTRKRILKLQESQ